jgi:hypothetical protein
MFELPVTAFLTDLHATGILQILDQLADFTRHFWRNPAVTTLMMIDPSGLTSCS